MKEASGEEDAVQMVDQLIADFTTVIGELKQCMEAAQASRYAARDSYDA